jgi:hypothetical protein
VLPSTGEIVTLISVPTNTLHPYYLDFINEFDKNVVFFQDLKDGNVQAYANGNIITPAIFRRDFRNFENISKEVIVTKESIFRAAQVTGTLQAGTTVAWESSSSGAIYLIAFSSSGLSTSSRVLEKRSSFTTPTGLYTGINNNAKLVGIRFFAGLYESTQASSLTVKVQEQQKLQQHGVGGGTTLKEQEIISTVSASSAVYATTGQVNFTPIDIPDDKVLYVDLINVFGRVTDLEVELIIQL